jgi:hypothetical protein
MATILKVKVIGLSIKDRCNLPTDILLIGHFGTAQQVLYLCTFMVQICLWVTEFNQEKRYMNYINKVEIYKSHHPPTMKV